MKSILSPYDDTRFNEYVLLYLKRRLRKRVLPALKADERRYYINEDIRSYKTAMDIINSLALKGRVIYYSNSKLVNYAVYDLGQRAWYEELKHVYNLIYRLYFEYRHMLQAREKQIKRQTAKEHAIKVGDLT